MPSEAELRGQLTELGAVLSARTDEHNRLLPYDEGGCPIPQAIVRGRMTRSYRDLMPQSEAPWGSLIVDSVLDRLEVSGIEDPVNPAVEDRVLEFWQRNSLDAESKLAHRAALRDGRAFALVWPDPDTGKPMVSLDDMTQMVVKYQSGSRRKRVAALRRFVEDGRVKATLYRPDGIFKFQAANTDGQLPTSVMGWERRDEGDGWQMPNPYNVVPVVEIAVNRQLKPGSYGWARGEYAHATGLLDRIHLLTFLGLVVAIWMGFPLRGLLGGKILKDDEGNTIPPFDSRPDSVFQDEDPAAKIVEFKAADRSNLSVFAELDQLAAVTKTPRHYFPIGTAISNIAEPTIRAFEGALHSKTAGHKASTGEGWEEVDRLGGLMDPEPYELSDRAALTWHDHESRSLAERADAAVKLAGILPRAALIERVLNISADEAGRLEAQGALADLLEAAKEPAPVMNGASQNGVPAN